MQMMEEKERDLFMEETNDGVSEFNGLSPDNYFESFWDESVLEGKVSGIKESLFRDLDNWDDDENTGRYLDYVKKLYSRDISKYPVLKYNELQDLFIKYQKLGKDSSEWMKIRDQIIYSNLKVAYKIAKNIYNWCKNSYKTNNINLNDIVQAWNIWLIRAVDSYSSKEWAKFISYAKRCITGTIYNYLKYDSAFFWLEYFRFIKPIRLFVDKFFSENWREPTDAEVEQYISKHNENSQDRMYIEAWYYYKFYLTHGLISLEQTVDADKKLELEDATYQWNRAFLIDDEDLLQNDDNYELILKDAFQSPENNIDIETNINDFRIVVDKLLGVLPYMERKVIELYYWVDGDGPLDLDEIAEMIELSRERVRQIKERWLKRIRKSIGTSLETHIRDNFM